jgi:tRNA nucleotidyltransferase (CCA-adding enzyme)
MRIILTHEQADFDALASLLGASLLDERAIPVLPRRMNRNVRAFVTLYGADLPFIEARDLPGGRIDHLTLVDTQSMISLKGMTSKTSVHVIDHHDRREDLPPEWNVTTEDVGATVTLFVEALHERGSPLSMVQATLLLLGIYEDTGSLTYTRTTSRDMRAAAYLVEQGANLGIASGFLNHPLSLKQQTIYDQLRSATETYNIHGHHIVVSCGDAKEMEEELSTVAHKLRDLLDPDGLILLIETRSGIQLIGRSTSDNIDVAEVAANFGGGGHSRAAAALIRDRQLDSVRQELLDILPKVVRPAITVYQIMSKGPQVLTPDTPVDEAADRMRRYGYEGYPVVDKGKVVGLLTRRAVDRAIGHNLNLTAASLMQAGEVTIFPDDPIEQLQKVMTDTGWGQIPVVSPEDGSVIGIVTRTDLLKTISQDAKLPSRQNLAEKLESALPAARLALLQAVARIAHKRGVALFIVGGFVRDLILERPSMDFDLVVEGDAVSLAQAVASHYGGRITSHSRFGTAKWFILEIREDLKQGLITEAAHNNQALPRHLAQPDNLRLDASDLPDTLDFISARTEFYTYPTALPTVERGSIKLDLHRRDFTINTLALRLDGRYYGELHDHWGGLNDLRQGLVRCLHSLSFVDDPTRMLRAVRFEQRFGFKIEGRTLQLLREAISLVERVSGDRIRHELDHILDEQRACAMLFRLEELQLLETITPHLQASEWLCERLEQLTSIDLADEWKRWSEASEAVSSRFKRDIPFLRRSLIYLIWMIRLPIPQVKEILSRLKFFNAQARNIEAACILWQNLPGLTSAPISQIVRRLDETPALALYGTYLALSDPQQRELLKKYADHWGKVSASISGHDLKKRGLSPGPRFREILSILRGAWLDGKIHNQDDEAALLDELIAEDR